MGPGPSRDGVFCPCVKSASPVSLRERLQCALPMAPPACSCLFLPPWHRLRCVLHFTKGNVRKGVLLTSLRTSEDRETMLCMEMQAA